MSEIIPLIFTQLDSEVYNKKKRNYSQELGSTFQLFPSIGLLSLLCAGKNAVTVKVYVTLAKP